MRPYAQLSPAQLADEKAALEQQYASILTKNLKINMQRGVPGVDQLDLSLPLLANISSAADCSASSEIRGYGLPDGLPEARALFAQLLEVPVDQVIAGGNSSLNLLHDYIARAYSLGVGGCQPWARQGAVKFICPSPGYDRHFAILELYGIEMITVGMTPTGPDMAAVTRLAADPAVKGMICVPKYSNPQGYTYSDDTVGAIAGLKPAAADFRILWDNAYGFHPLYDTDDRLANVLLLAEQAGNPDRVVVFVSTSKITFPGAGVAAMASGKNEINEIKKRISVQTIGPDKINQLRHIKFLRDADGVREHMKRHAALLRPKFEAVDAALTAGLAGTDTASWNKPRGGYFISLDVLPGCAKRAIELSDGLGISFTPAGATFPYRRDPSDQNIRIAPTFPPAAELTAAIEALCVCVKLAAVEKLLA